MASVHLRFMVPDQEDLIEMKIYEGATPTGTFVEIETVTPIGAYPDYIDEYTTENATTVSDYFSIEFLDSKGATTGLSQAVKGDEELLIGEIVQRVLERDSSINERVALQEAESSIQWAYPGYDPYDPALQVNYVEKRGLTNLTLAMCYLTEISKGVSSGWVAGIVSLKFSDVAIQQRVKSIEGLIKQANKDLGLTFSMVAYLEDLEVAGITQVESIDQTRLLVELR